MRFSIIVPVYNVEKYLEQCIKSILCQTYNDYEIILINDGSTDNSKKVCESFRNNDKVSFIDIKNKGVSNARNIGIEKARGEYILFVDSDDYLKENALETIAKQLNEDIDLLIFSSEKKYINNEKKLVLKDEVINKDEALKYLLKDNYYCGYVWNKAFKRKIISDNHLQFDVNVHMNEDLLFCFKYIKEIRNKVMIISDILYDYRVRKSSALNSIINKKNVTSIIVYKYIFENCEINEVEKNAKLYYLRSYYKYKKYSDEFDLKLIYQIKKESYATISIKEKIKMMIYKYFPKMKILIIKIENIILKPYK